MTDYTVELFYEYNGENWVILQNGEKIIFAKKSSLIKMNKYGYALSDKTKEVICNVSDIDVITIKK